MQRDYRLNQKLLAAVLLVSLFLQSCSDFSNFSAPEVKESIDFIASSPNERDDLKSNNATAIKELAGRELTAKGGHLVIFHEQDEKLQADVEMNIPEGFSKTYTNLSVNIAPDIDVAQLSHLNKEEQQRIIHFNLSQSGQPASISICKKGLLGGMKRKREDEDKEKDKEGEKKDKLTIEQSNSDKPNKHPH